MSDYYQEMYFICLICDLGLYHFGNFRYDNLDLNYLKDHVGKVWKRKKYKF